MVIVVNGQTIKTEQYFPLISVPEPEREGVIADMFVNEAGYNARVGKIPNTTGSTEYTIASNGEYVLYDAGKVIAEFSLPNDSGMSTTVVILSSIDGIICAFE